MGKVIKTTVVRRPSQLLKIKSTGYSIILGRNLVKKQKEKKRRKKMAKIIWKGVAKKDDPIYGGGFIISYPKRKSSAYLDKTDTKSQKNNKDKGLKNEKKEK